MANENEQIEWIEDEDDNAFRQGLFQTDDRQEVIVPVPEWKRKVLIKRLTGTARSEFIALQTELLKKYEGTTHPEYLKQTWFELVRRGCLNPKTRNHIFKPGDRDTWMSEHDGGVIERLGKVVQIFSQLDGTIANEAKKNLGLIPNTSTTFNSQNNSDKVTGKSQTS
jgi:hypothetical protein